ncbi:MAG: hypothetical protein A2681_01035 [Candidatus Liptonbacteria bacterium RIFCSPHIGHO2_01_FULL_56_18b]|nr:MAG: hypothetical protein A2681_01035 [Candidatus Liptonbacteria bacterium RIFCSPHIGHO2_01_FULL_56_18b]
MDMAELTQTPFPRAAMRPSGCDAPPFGFREPAFGSLLRRTAACISASKLRSRSEAELLTPPTASRKPKGGASEAESSAKALAGELER